MILIIDTTNADHIELFLAIDQKISKKNVIGHNRCLETLLPSIDELLKTHNLALKDIEAIAVNEGPGGYTGLRIGITTANTLAWALDIPVLPFSAAVTDVIIDSARKHLTKNSKFINPVSPKYLNTL